MPSSRRTRGLIVVLGLAVLLILYFTADARHAGSQEFYSRTLQRLEQERQAAAGGSDSGIGARLKDAESAAKKAADAKVPAPPDLKAAIPSIQRKTKQPLADDGSLGDAIKVEGAGAGQAVVKDDASRGTGAKVATKEEHEAEVELNSILKRSPIIIFSKSYCPYSAKAKMILLERYKIVPSPFVVELDQHPLGPQLQSALEKTTGRRTVPNVLVNGKSIGGGDDMQELDEKGIVSETLRKFGGKRIMEVSKVIVDI